MSNDDAVSRYPGYDVLAKRDTPSWDPITRELIDERLRETPQPQFLEQAQWTAALALCACVVAQPAGRPPVPLAAMLDARLRENQGDGWRNARLPPLRDAWRIGLAALDAESRAAHGMPFAGLQREAQLALLESMQRGELTAAAWQGMPADLFFSERVLRDLYGAYYSHPTSWSEIGFGGPANPRGYVRLDKNRRDPWEAIEAPSAASAEERAAISARNSHVR